MEQTGEGPYKSQCKRSKGKSQQILLIEKGRRWLLLRLHPTHKLESKPINLLLQEIKPDLVRESIV